MISVWWVTAVIMTALMRELPYLKSIKMLKSLSGRPEKLCIRDSKRCNDKHSLHWKAKVCGS